MNGTHFTSSVEIQVYLSIKQVEWTHLVLSQWAHNGVHNSSSPLEI